MEIGLAILVIDPAQRPLHLGERDIALRFHGYRTVSTVIAPLWLEPNRS